MRGLLGFFGVASLVGGVLYAAAIVALWDSTPALRGVDGWLMGVMALAALLSGVFWYVLLLAVADIHRRSEQAAEQLAGMGVALDARGARWTQVDDGQEAPLYVRLGAERESPA